MSLLFAILLYVALQLGIGFAAYRKTKSEADYLVAGRRLGYPLAIFSIFATWFGAETCLGSAAEVYQHGIAGSRADPFGYTLCLVLMGLVFAVPLYKRELLTLADLFRTRYSVRVERLAALLLAPSSLFWAGAQIRAFGLVLHASSDVGLDFALLIAAAVVVVYTFSGGLLADAVTDLVQGAVLIVGLVVLSGFVVSASGGLGAAFTSMEGTRPSLPPEVESLWAMLDGWAVPVCGSVLAQELVSRVLAARSATVARRSALTAAAIYVAVGCLPVLLGLLAQRTLPGVADPETVLPELARRHLPTLAYVLFAGALVSAILSTVDSALLAAASLVSHNVVLSFRPTVSERAKVAWARAFVVVFGVVAYFLAIGSSSVFELVEQASGFASSGALVAVVFGLFTRFGGPLAATSALLVGVVTWLVLAYLVEATAPYLTSLALAFLGYCAAALGERRLARQKAIAA